MIALGSRVTFTHKAAVARREKSAPWETQSSQEWGDWRLTEPKTNVLSHRNGMPTIMTNVTPIVCVEAEEFVELPTNVRYPKSEERWANRNKSVFVWPDEGSGIVVGAISKQFGMSHPSRGEDDLGYLEVFGQIMLYVVKAELRGPQVYVAEPHIHVVHEMAS